MNEKVLNLAIIILFASIIINSILLMLSFTPSGGWIIGLTSNDLSYDSLKGTSNDVPEGFISNTSQSQDASSFNPFSIDGLLAGVYGINLIISGLFLLEMIFFKFSVEFVVFAPIFLGLATILIGSKLLLVAYAGSVLLNAITGRRA